MSEMPQVMTAEQLAERWQVSTDHVYALAREDRIPAIRLGRRIRFRRDAIERFELGVDDGTIDEAA